MLPKDINDIFEEYDENDYSILLKKVDSSTNVFQLYFDLRVRNFDAPERVQRWTVEATGYRKSRVFFSACYSLKIIEDDPLLWEFTDTQSELYYNGQTENPSKLFLDLYLTHKKLFDDYQPVDTYLGVDVLQFKALRYSNGLLAKGSKRLMGYYAECLKQNGLSFTMIGDRQPKYWDGSKFISENQNVRLLLLGDTYVIAETFSFVRLDESSR